MTVSTIKFFVKKVLHEMLDHDEISVDVDKVDTIVIGSDNCKGQYKSAQHFYDMQELANTLNKRILRI